MEGLKSLAQSKLKQFDASASNLYKILTHVANLICSRGHLVVLGYNFFYLSLSLSVFWSVDAIHPRNKFYVISTSEFTLNQ